MKGTLLLAGGIALALCRCGDSSSKDDADTGVDGDVAIDEVLDVPGEDFVDIPADNPEETEPDAASDAEPDAVEDVPTDDSVCPAPPDCEEPLVLGAVNAIDENGCIIGYCCTGISVDLEEVTVRSGIALALGGTASVTNIGDTSVMTAYLHCEIKNPVDDSTVATCDQVSLVTETPLDVGAEVDVPLEPSCTLEGSEPCFDPVDVECTFHWSTIGCYSEGEGTVTATTDFLCVG